MAKKPANKEARVEFRADESDVERWRAAAHADGGMTLALWIRRALNEAAKKGGKS